MCTKAHYFRAAIAAICLSSPALAGDRSETSADQVRAAAASLVELPPGPDTGGLQMRRPYERGKVPVILIHGLWGFPRMWDWMIESLEADPTIRGRYQFWTFCYASGDSIPYSAHLLRQTIGRARQTFDPGHTDAALDRMVIVGHSLGGILAKMMVEPSGSDLWQTVCARGTDKAAGPAEEWELLRHTFCYEPVPEVRRVIFITTPHRGSPLTGGLLRGVGTQLCGGSSRFRQAREVLLAKNDPELFTARFRGELPTSVGELAPGHALLSALCDQKIDPSVSCHSIIADLGDPPGRLATDGIVPYWSSHWAGAESELLVHSHHICLNHPTVIREVGRILSEHSAKEMLQSAVLSTSTSGKGRP
jgi:pimeloyl-ACP methyl ester carboxylesterase